jgi:hypothetical protein
VFSPGVFNEDKRTLFFFWSPEFQRRTEPANERQARVPTALERLGDFSRSVDASGNPFPYIRDYTTGLPCGSADTRGCFAAGGVLGRIPQNRLYQPGVNALRIFPDPNFTGGSGINFTSQDPNESPRREDLIRLDFQATDKWRFTGRYMNTKENILQAYGTTWAGNGSDHLPMPVTFLHPGKNYMLSTTGILNPTMSLEISLGRAENSLNYQLEMDNLYRSASGLTAMPLLFPDALQADYIPDFRFRGGRTGNAGFYQTDRGPFTERTRRSSGCTSSTATSRRASSRASTARSTSSTTSTTRSTRGTPTRTRPRACSGTTRRLRSMRCRSGGTRTSSGTRRTTGRRASA